MDKSYECICLVVNANPSCSCCFLSWFCIVSASCHVLFLSVLNLYLKPFILWWRWHAKEAFFPACSSWINILTSSMRVCSDGIPHWLYLFPLFKRLVCQHRGLLWAKNKRPKSLLSPLHRNLQMYILFLLTAEWDYTRAPAKMDGGMKP